MRGPDPLPCLSRMAKGLEAQGCTILTMPCNTAHAFYDSICEEVSIPFLNMPRMAAARAVELALAATRPEENQGDGSPPSVGVLASTVVQHLGVYDSYFDSTRIKLVFPNAQEQERLMALIMDIKSVGF